MLDFDLNAIETVQLIFIVLGGVFGGLLVVSGLWPFMGTLIRFWAHYRPKRVVLGDEQRGLLRVNAEDDAPTFNGYWGLFLRVKRVEGIRGLWKGLGTFYLTFLCNMTLFLLAALLFAVFRVAFSPSLPFILLAFIVCIYVISIPMRVIVNRSVTTSRRLRFAQPLMAFRTLLFTPAERRNPFRLCLLPGLLISVILLDLEGTIVSSLKVTITKALYYDRTFSLQGVGLSIVLSSICALLTTPLEVIITRLSVQETPSEDLNSESLPPPAVGQGGYQVAPSQETEGLPNYQESEGIEYAGSDEDVITLRADQEPYKGMVDCARCIVREEGWGTFWRGWLIPATLFFMLDMEMITLRNMGMGI